MQMLRPLCELLFPFTERRTTTHHIGTFATSKAGYPVLFSTHVIHTDPPKIYESILYILLPDEK